MAHRNALLTALTLAAALCTPLCAGLALASTANPVAPIPRTFIAPWDLLADVWKTILAPGNAALCAGFTRFVDAEAVLPIAHAKVPDHPFMASWGGNNMHCDAYISDTYEAAGPLGLNVTVRSRTQGFGGYGTLTFDQSGRIVAVYSNGRGFQLELLDPYTLEELASYDLPPRPWYWILQGIMPWEYIGAGMYFYLDERDRAVVPTTQNTIQVVGVAADGKSFELIREYDLSEYVVPMLWPHKDSVAWVLPDWSGAYYWYATTGGMVGTVDVQTGAVHTLRLEGEIIENSFAAAEDGVYILSYYALYRFRHDGAGRITVDWRTPYERGPGRKPGHITRGSGTSVSLIGDADDGLVAITDNAEPQIHLVLVARGTGVVVGSVPLFEPGASGTDISVACFEHADDTGQGIGLYSVLIENNWGHHRFPYSVPQPGLTRVDVAGHPDGTYTSEVVWESEERSIGVFKLSLGSGLIYMYWRDDACTIPTWSLTAIDFATGETAYRKHVGTGLGYNNWAGALFLHPGGGVAYSTTIFGLVMIYDDSR